MHEDAKYCWDDLPDAPAADPTVVDKHGLAAFLGMSLKDIDRMLREGLPIHGARRRGVAVRFRVPDCAQWMLARVGASAEATKRRIELATARKRESEANKLDDLFVEIAEVETAIKDNVARFQSELEAIPMRLPAEVRDVAQAEIDAAVNRLAAGLRP